MSAHEVVKIGEVASLISGYGFPVALQGQEGTIPFYKVSDMNSDGNEIGIDLIVEGQKGKRKLVDIEISTLHELKLQFNNITKIDYKSIYQINVLSQLPENKEIITFLKNLLMSLADKYFKEEQEYKIN